MQLECKICGAVCHEIAYKKIKSRYHACTKCEFIFKDESCLISDEQALKIYTNHNNSIHDPVYQAYFREFINTCIEGYISGQIEILDFGSGPEPVLAHLLKKDYAYSVDVYDVFFSPEKVYEGKLYDLITATEVVEHLETPIAYFELFKSLLKPGGLLAVMTQFHHCDVERFEHWHYRRDESHVSFFTPKTMAVIAERTGFEILFIDAHKNVTFRRL